MVPQIPISDLIYPSGRYDSVDDTAAQIPISDLIYPSGRQEIGLPINQVPIPPSSAVGQPIPGLNGFGRDSSYLPVQMPSSTLPANFNQWNTNEQNTYLRNLENQNGGIKWLGKDGVLIPGLNALSNLSKAITGYQQLGLAKEAFDFNKRLTETNLANQARTTNADIIARERSQLRQRGGNQIPNLDQLARIRSQDRLVKGTL